MDILKKDEQYKKVIETLIKKGAFAISNIEQGNSASKKTIYKALKEMVEGQILMKNVKKGAGVRYKLRKTEEGITFLLKDTREITIKHIARSWDVNIASAKKYVKRFIDEKIIEKVGKPPKKINYKLTSKESTHIYSKEAKKVIGQYYTHITPEGMLLQGIEAFEYFVIDRYGKDSVGDIAQKYVNTRREYYGEKMEIKMVDATNKIKNTFKNEVYIEKLFYSDFDELKGFEKTELYQLINIAKAGQVNTEVMFKITNELQKNITEIINKYDIDAIAFIPPTILRKSQLMTFLKNRIVTTIPIIKLRKASNLLPIEQKSLKRIKDRKRNASKTIQVATNTKYESVLLIDDITGSGATFNETAKKMLKKDTAQKVYAISAVGAVKPGVFEIIPET